jgi:Transglycosylase SLT domain
MRVAPEIIAGICRDRARDLILPTPKAGMDVDPVKLLWALAGVESSFGQDSHPRHENGYCYAGRYFDPKRTAEWGCLAHCSFGPWQVMFDHFPESISPVELLPQGNGRTAAELSVRAAILILNKAIAGGARNLTDLVIAYNGPGDVPEYSKRLFASYDRPMPQYQETVPA